MKRRAIRLPAVAVSAALGQIVTSGISAGAALGWLHSLRAPPEQTTVTPFVAISAVRVKVEVLRKGRWVEITTVTFQPAMGC